jgi:hypothetical protein
VKIGEHELNADTLMLGHGYIWLLGSCVILPSTL